MKELIGYLEAWQQAHEHLALARVLRTWGSSPRPVGAALLIAPDGKMAGSVSGGCVESAVVKQAAKVLADGQPRLLQFGIGNEEAWSVGLTCGGKLEVWLERLDTQEALWGKWLEVAKADEAQALITRLSDEDPAMAMLTKAANLGDPLPEAVLAEAKSRITAGSPELLIHESVEYLIHPFPPKDHLLLIGAAHITVDLVALAASMGFRTSVIDPRGYFAANVVFPTPPDQLYQAYPSEVLPTLPLHAQTYCAVLSHDPKIDDDALAYLLASPVRYIGAMGSRKTHAKRLDRLREQGFAPEQLARIFAPIGLPLGGRRPQEIAFSIMAEILAVKHQAAIGQRHEPAADI